MTLGTSGKLGIVAFAAVLVCGCADGGMNLTTASVTPDASATALKADPMCVSLANQINALNQDGTIDRLEKAAAGKSETVRVKRDALLKQTELNKANVEFQTRCGPKIPKQVTAQSAPPATTPAETAKVAASGQPSAGAHH